MAPLSQATREIMWNVSYVPLFYAIFVVAMAVLAAGLFRRVEFLRKGKPDARPLADLTQRFLFMLKEVFSQIKAREKPFPGLFHAFLFYSFLVLVVTTSVVALDYDFGTSLFRGYFYVLLTVGSEFAGLFVLAGVLVALWRRHVRRPATLQAKPADTCAFLLLGLVIVTGFAAEALRIAVAGDPWRGISFVAAAIAPAFSGLDPGSGTTLHARMWWLHAVLAFGWIAAIPYTNYRHLLLLPANVLFSKRTPAGELARVDLDAEMEREDFDAEAFTIGVGAVGDLTWKQRLDGDACVECGRCEEVCPAFLAGQPFSPKRLIVSTRDLAHACDEGADGAEGADDLVGNALDEDFVWRCLTCMACVQTCPAYITHVDTFVDVRRNELSMKGRAGADVSRLVRALEVQGNPFGSQIVRGQWVQSLGVPVLAEGGACDVLYWVGCLTTFDEQKRQIAEDLMGVLKQCGIDFALLGKAEICCGDPARLCGAESVFQSIVKRQVEALSQRKFNTLLVSCPHCYNALKNEYPQFGGRYNVVHHSELLRDLLGSGRLRAAGTDGGRTVYHDPCYLGRYQGIYDAPREAIRKASGAAYVEMERYREKSFCCGGGGGHFWMENKEGERIDTMRIRQAKSTNANRVVTSCPYCFHMLSDATKTLGMDKEMRVVDIVSHVVGR